MQLSNSEMMEFLKETDLSEDTKKAIVTLIKANDSRLREDIPRVISEKAKEDARKRGYKI